jgi:N-formylglutamate amidohydrolase
MELAASDSGPSIVGTVWSRVALDLEREEDWG